MSHRRPRPSAKDSRLVHTARLAALVGIAAGCGTSATEDAGGRGAGGVDPSASDADSGERDAASVDSAAEGGSPDELTKACVERSRDEPRCKDCCDCAAVACTESTPCRDACKLHDFSQNTAIVDPVVTSTLGPAGDYGACVSGNATEDACKTCCECTSNLACGDYQYCRTLCDRSYAADAGAAPTFDAPQLVRGGFQFAEGPVWQASTGSLLFSDVQGDTVYRLVPPGTITTFRTPSRRANGLALDPAGLLLAAEYASRSVTRTRGDGTIETVAVTYQGKRFNSPNDVAVRSDGTIYFTDPSFGLVGASEIGVQGLYRVALDGSVTLEMSSDKSPNGVAFARDEKTLYVAVTFQNEVLAFDVAADGSTSAQRTFAFVDEPDGICVAASGRVYVAGKDAGTGAVVVLDAAGARLATVPIADGPTNCEVGGSVGQWLFVTARAGLYRLAAPAGGL